MKSATGIYRLPPVPAVSMMALRMYSAGSESAAGLALQIFPASVAIFLIPGEAIDKSDCLRGSGQRGDVMISERVRLLPMINLSSSISRRRVSGILLQVKRRLSVFIPDFLRA